MSYELRALVKHIDERGELVEILKGNEVDEEIEQIYFSTSKPGAIRGNHYHKRKVEWFSVIKGIAQLTLKDNISNEEKEIILSSDQPAMVKIMPNTLHSIQNIGTEEMYLVIIANEIFDKNDADTFYN